MSPVSAILLVLAVIIVIWHVLGCHLGYELPVWGGCISSGLSMPYNRSVLRDRDNEQPSGTAALYNPFYLMREITTLENRSQPDHLENVP